ncbi:FeoA family protein [Desulfothermus okinawensis JCM 13304]
MKRLSQVTEGDEVILMDIIGGRSIRSKLFNMGLTPGIKIKTINNNSSGPIVLVARNSKLVLGRGMAEKIMVK